MKKYNNKKMMDYGVPYIIKEAWHEGRPMFTPMPHMKNWWRFHPMPDVCSCTIIHNEAWTEIEIHAFGVHGEKDRGQGHGERMAIAVRECFPDAHIWVDTWEHSRGFWEKMMAKGYIDSIGNDYHWPCHNHACKPCHPSRANGRRRAVC